MTGLVADVEQSVAIVVLVRLALSLVPGLAERWWQTRPPRGAVALVALVAVPTLAQVVWPALGTALRRDPSLIADHHQWWRLVTAVLVQDAGLVGVVFNLVSLAVVAVVAVRYWGAVTSWCLFLALGVVLDLAGLLGDSTGAGSSGATYGLVASVVGHGVVRHPGRVRWAGLGVLALGALIWVLGNVHGMAVVAGGVVGAALAVLAPVTGDAQRGSGAAGPGDQAVAPATS